CQQGNTLPTF
nr:immunoglobulin light chain junction region [Mus musculus]